MRGDASARARPLRGRAPATVVPPDPQGRCGLRPRGLASLLFAILILEEVELPHGHEIFTLVIVTVLLSVFAHGLTAAPGADAYSRVSEDAA